MANTGGHEWSSGDKGLTFRFNKKEVFHGSGSEIAALDPITPTSRYAFAGNGNDSVGSNHLTANGSPTYGSDGGVYGQYAILNGTSQYFTAANNTVFDVTTQDFSMWGLFYKTATGLGVIATKRDANVGGPGYEVYINASEQLTAAIQDSGGTTIITLTSPTVSLNTWYFWAASFDRDGNCTLHLYNYSTGAHDSLDTSISTRTGSLTNTLTFTVARSTNVAGNYWPGRIDHLNVLIGTAITSAQVEDIISNLHGGQLAVCHGTGSGFTANRVYQRNQENTSWEELVELDETQTLTNKTINATNNTITDTSTATGDLLKSNGTKFVRFARGTALQVPRVNSGATDLEYSTIKSRSVCTAVALAVESVGSAKTLPLNGAMGANEDDSSIIPIACTIRDMAVDVLTAPGVNQAVTLTKNGSNTSVTITALSGTTGKYYDNTNTATFVKGDIAATQYGSADVMRVRASYVIEVDAA